MVVINKGLANDLYFNLTSKKRLADSPYIFIKFTNDMTKQNYFVTPTETVNPRYSLIEFTEGTDISLGAEGFYTYVIYELSEQINIFTDNDNLPEIFTNSAIQDTYPYGVSPEGTTTSTRLQYLIGINSAYLYPTDDLTDGQTYTFSCYYKGTAGETVYMRANATGSQDINKEITLNGSWQREEISFISGTSDTMFIVDTTLGGTATDIEVWSPELKLSIIDDSTLSNNQILERGKALVKDASVTEVSYTQYTPTSNKNTTNSNTQYISI